MKKFIVRTLFFSILLISTIYLIFLQADGSTDAYYLKFATPKQCSLILGTSRTAQGILPHELNVILGRNDFFNFAFTLAHSPYGPTYLNTIKKKIECKGNDGIFILSVDPWCISSKGSDPDDTLHFRELKNCLANTPDVDRNPNIPYLMNNMENHYFKILQKNSKTFLHNDGWLEVKINMDSSTTSERVFRKVEDYRKDNLPRYQFSKVRLSYLIKTIDFLKQFGEVYLVRLPIHPKMMEVEDVFMPDFGNRIQGAIDESSGFLDMTPMNSNFTYTDGNHLYKNSGRIVSQEIGQWILLQKGVSQE